MTYDWASQKGECYRLWVIEKKTMDEVVKYFNNERDFPASVRAFQCQFRKWNFVPRHRPATRIPELVKRTRELWEQHIGAAELLRTLREEGHDITESQLRRLRSKNGMLLRESRSSNPQPRTVGQASGAGNGSDGDDAAESEDEDEDEDEDDDDDDEFMAGQGDGDDVQPQQDSTLMQSRIAEDVKLAVEQTLTPLELAQRANRRQELIMESTQLFMNKKRRRRIKGYAGLPADPPGPPRYPSEMSLEESKAILQLDKTLYDAIRSTFQRVCEEEGILKKTVTGPERWEAAKERLVRETMHLRAIMWDPTDGPLKKLAIDQIACDVTKRMRNAQRKLSLPHGRRILGINPEQGREARFALVQIMAAEKFVSKIDSGKERWEAMMARWISETGFLNQALNGAGGPGLDPEYAIKAKAVELIARDAMRRWVDLSGKKAAQRAEANAKREERERQRAEEKAAKTKLAAEAAAAEKAEKARQKELKEQQERENEEHARQNAQLALTTTPLPVAAPRKRGRPRKQTAPPQQQATHYVARLVPMEGPEDTLDADLSLGTQLGSFTESPDLFLSEQYAPAPAPALVAQAFPPAPTPTPTPTLTLTAAPATPSSTVVAYFRLHPASNVASGAATAAWLAMLPSRSIKDLRSAAVQKYPGATCLSVTGVVKDGNGGELPLPVTDDEELGSYLQHVQDMAVGAPTFMVLLQGAT